MVLLHYLLWDPAAHRDLDGGLGLHCVGCFIPMKDLKVKSTEVLKG